MDKFFIITILFSVCFLFSCRTTKIVESNEEQDIEETMPYQEEIFTEPEVVETEAEKNPVDEEYERSVKNVGATDVPKETFQNDKAKIMSIINELSKIMKNANYNLWLKYIDDESIAYWSNPRNLQRASQKLPIKGLKMTNLKDYFTYVFVPSRKDRKVDEIRYDSKDSVKAVQVSEDTDIIYYYFHKINDKWLVNIPPIE